MCGYNNNNSSIHSSSARSAKTTKEALNCQAAFTLTVINNLVTSVNFKVSNHTHPLDKELSHIILPALKLHFINESHKPLCFLDQHDIQNIHNNFNLKYPELSDWPTSIKSSHKFCKNQLTSLFGDSELTVQAQMLNILNYYNLKDGQWGDVLDSGYYMCFEIPDEDSTILWVGSFLGPECIKKLAVCSNYQFNLDGTYGTAKFYFEEDSKKCGVKTDLYLIVAQAPDMVLPIGAFLSKSDKISSVMEGLEAVNKLYNKIGIKLYGNEGLFNLLMSDNQSGLHNRLKKVPNL